MSSQLEAGDHRRRRSEKRAAAKRLAAAYAAVPDGGDEDDVSSSFENDEQPPVDPRRMVADNVRCSGSFVQNTGNNVSIRGGKAISALGWPPFYFFLALFWPTGIVGCLFLRCYGLPMLWVYPKPAMCETTKMYCAMGWMQTSLIWLVPFIYCVVRVVSAVLGIPKQHALWYTSVISTFMSLVPMLVRDFMAQ